MRKWKHKLEPTLPNEPKAAAAKLARLLETLPVAFRAQGSWDCLDDAISWLRDDVTCTEDFDDILRFVYDWGDDFDLWLYVQYED